MKNILILIIIFLASGCLLKPNRNQLNQPQNIYSYQASIRVITNDTHSVVMANLIKGSLNYSQKHKLFENTVSQKNALSEESPLETIQCSVTKTIPQDPKLLEKKTPSTSSEKAKENSEMVYEKINLGSLFLSLLGSGVHNIKIEPDNHKMYQRKIPYVLPMGLYEVACETFENEKGFSTFISLPESVENFLIQEDPLTRDTFVHQCKNKGYQISWQETKMPHVLNKAVIVMNAHSSIGETELVCEQNELSIPSFQSRKIWEIPENYLNVFRKGDKVSVNFFRSHRMVKKDGKWIIQLMGSRLKAWQEVF